MGKIISSQFPLLFFGFFFIVASILCMIGATIDHKLNKPDKKDYKTTIAGLSLMIIIGIGLILLGGYHIKRAYDDLYYYCNNDKGSILVKEYGMKCEAEDKDNVRRAHITKNNCKLDYIYYFQDYNLYDQFPFDNECEGNVFKVVFDDVINNRDGLLEMIQSNLISNARYLENTSEMNIYTDYYLFDITYDFNTKQIRYSIDSNTNNVRKGLYIMHSDNEDPEFDNKLLQLLFNANIDYFNVKKENNMIEYSFVGERYE